MRLKKKTEVNCSRNASLYKSTLTGDGKGIQCEEKLSLSSEGKEKRINRKYINNQWIQSLSNAYCQNNKK